MKFINVLLLTCITLSPGLGIADETPVTPKANLTEMPHHEKLNQRLAEDSDNTINTSNIKLSDSYAEKRDDEWKNWCVRRDGDTNLFLRYSVPIPSSGTAMRKAKITRFER
jgi:hypothetical protein